MFVRGPRQLGNPAVPALPRTREANARNTAR